MSDSQSAEIMGIVLRGLAKLPPSDGVTKLARSLIKYSEISPRTRWVLTKLWRLSA